ncbi:MAG: hypothetical protein WC316_05330 [Candidatus Omnitrophota bacterium]|jgi:flagellar biosynthesis/type III secretory pathway M-ring protein FliF/YscJ
MNKGYIAVMAIVLILVVAIVSGSAGIAIGKFQARKEMFRQARSHWEMRGDKMGPDDMVPGMRRAERGQRFDEFARDHRERPEHMKQVMDGRKEKVRERLLALKKEDPEKFGEVMKKIDALEKNLASLKKELAAEPAK